MKKSILNLKGAQELSKNEQKETLGGKVANHETCEGKIDGQTCGSGKVCCLGACVSPTRDVCHGLTL